MAEIIIKFKKGTVYNYNGTYGSLKHPMYVKLDEEHIDKYIGTLYKEDDKDKTQC